MSWAEEQDWFGLEDLASEDNMKELDTPQCDNKDIYYIQVPVWLSKGGRIFKIDEMTTEHIKHCINCILHCNKTWRAGYLRLFEAELHRRGQAIDLSGL